MRPPIELPRPGSSVLSPKIELPLLTGASSDWEATRRVCASLARSRSPPTRRCSPVKDQVMGVGQSRLAHVGHAGLAVCRSLRALLGHSTNHGGRVSAARGASRQRVRREHGHYLVRRLASSEVAAHRHGRRKAHAAQHQPRIACGAGHVSQTGLSRASCLQHSGFLFFLSIVRGRLLGVSAAGGMVV